MSDKNLWQRELAQVNRDQREEEQRRLDERWDRLSRGELSPEEEAELRALAETSEEAHAAYEAFRPLGPEFHASVVQAIRKKRLVTRISDLAGLVVQAIRKQGLATLLSFRQWLFAGWRAAAALATASAVVWVLIPPALPPYSLGVTASVSTSRGEEPETAERPVLAPGEGFTMLVRPATAVSRASFLKALCILTRDGELRFLEVQSEIDPSGAVKMKGTLGRDIPPGTWTFWAVVGRPGTLPEPAVLLGLSPGARVRQRNWVAVPKNVRIQPRDQPP